MIPQKLANCVLFIHFLPGPQVAPRDNGKQEAFLTLTLKSNGIRAGVNLPPTMAQGDHIYVAGTLRGIPFQHHGIDMGDGTVIHLAPAEGVRFALRDTSERFAVRRDTMEVFCMGRTPVVVTHPRGRTADEVVQTAESYLGKTGYSLLEGNCEHFAALCASGASKSHQIEMAEATLSAAASMATKAVWALTGRVGAKLLVKGVSRVHPALLIADGVEMATLAVTCRQGMTAERSRALAKWSSNLAAAGIGGLVGGPAGVAISLAAHSSSGMIAQRLCKVVRRALS